MLNYHLLIGQERKHPYASFIHFLSVGSHASPFTLPCLRVFSIVTLLPKAALPILDVPYCIVPLKGTLRANGVNCYLYSCVENANHLKEGEEGQSNTVFVMVSTSGQKPRVEHFYEDTTFYVYSYLLYVVKGALELHPGLQLKESMDTKYACVCMNKKTSFKVEAKSSILRINLKDDKLCK